MQHNKKGFTLIELLIVVVIIGILAAIAVPKFSSTKQKAYMAAMKTDLRNYSTAMEGVAAENAGKYIIPDTSQYQTSQNVEITPTLATDSTGWSAIATDSRVSQTCGVYVNTAKPTGMNVKTKEGEVECWATGGGDEEE